MGDNKDLFKKESCFDRNNSINNDDTLVISDCKKMGHLTCRFCLNGASKKIDAKSCNLFKLLTNVELVDTTEYPKGICSYCESKLESACEFQFTLLNVEQCWKTYFHNKYVEFLKRLKEDNVYDDILIEVEMESGTEDGDQLFDPSAVSLLKSKDPQQDTSKDSYTFQSDVQFTHVEPRQRIAFDKFSRDLLPFMTRQTVHDFKQCQPHENEYVQPSESLAISDYMSINEIGAIGSEAAEVKREQYVFEGLNQFSNDTMNAEEEYAMSRGMNRESDFFPIYCSRELTNSTRNDKYLKRYNSVKSKSSQIKCVLIGDAGVGKTNLILSYLSNKFVEEHVLTAYDIYNFDVKVNDTPVHVTLCDTGGQHSLDQLRQLSYPNCNVFVLCFSVVQPESFFAIKHKWAPKFYKTEASLLLVGTQSDLRTDTQVIDNLKKRGLSPVPVIDSLDLASSIGAEFIETSSRNHLGVKEAFDTAIWEALQALKMKNSKKSRFWKKLICLS